MINTIVILCSILWIIFGIISLLWVIIDVVKCTGNLKEFKLTFIEYVSMFIIIIAGPIAAIKLMFIYKDN